MEPDLSLFVYCLKNFDMRDIISDARVHFFVDTINYEDIYFSFLNTITEVMLPNQIVCTYPEMDRIYGDKAQNFMEIIKNFIMSMRKQYIILSKICILLKEVII